MKKLSLAICLVVALVMTLWATDIRGRLSGYQGEMVLVKAGNKVDTLRVAGDGSFVYQCKATEPFMEVGFYRYGKDPILMRLNDGDKVSLEAIKETDGHVRVVFQGDRKELNHYLTYYEYRNGFEQWPMDKMAGMPFLQHAAAVDAMEKELVALLGEIRGEEKQLVPGLKNKLQSEMLTLKQRYCWAIRAIKKEPMDRDADYVAFARSLNMNDEAWYEREKEEVMGGYPGLLDGRIRWEIAVHNDPRNGTDLSSAAYIEWVRKLVKSDKIANALIDRCIYNYLGMGANAKVDEVYQTYLKYSTDAASHTEIAAKYKEVAELGAGKMAPDFELKDENGKVYRLSDFRGKNLYIDVWATWCGPCVGEIPYFEKKHQQYKDAKDLEFISISVDVNRTAWKKKLGEDKPGWRQFIVDKGTKSDLNTKYGINGIPRFMLIDKEGKIITVNAPRPSDPQIDMYLQKFSK